MTQKNRKYDDKNIRLDIWIKKYIMYICVPAYFSIFKYPKELYKLMYITNFIINITIVNSSLVGVGAGSFLITHDISPLLVGAACFVEFIHYQKLVPWYKHQAEPDYSNRM
jgi:hypothetical protein